ncbi:hypothetical protein [Nocardia lijiangensis]|uniref:hypothetical protein n=1 Tax=Nocardia lijiangensis TaxID=299618 RepID=UPI000832CC4F|nr:hypothetical protein [Nocardia lijiangensis]
MSKKLRATAAAFAIAPAIALGAGIATAEPTPTPTAEQRHEVVNNFFAPVCLPVLLPSINVAGFLICLA